MEDINYVFNGEIRGNFNSYILIYDNFFLLKAICLGCAHKRLKWLFLLFLRFLGLRKKEIEEDENCKEHVEICVGTR